MRRLALGVLVALSIALLALTLLPVIESDRWFVRMADFPRLQLMLAMLVAIVALLPFWRRAPLGVGLLLLGLGAGVASHALTLWPYRPAGKTAVAACPAESRLSVLVANVLMENRSAVALIETVRREQPDLLLALETDRWWADALAPLTDSMPSRIGEAGDEHFGMLLFSRLPLRDPALRRFAGQDVPAIVSGVTLRSGETIGFVGLHPRPPHPSQSSTGRDAQLYEAALAVRDSGRPSVLAGDLNATPWERSAARMQRIGRLIDPRRGYGFVPTYSEHSWWRAWPLDQVFHQPGFATISLERLAPIGSDHAPFIARLCRDRQASGEPPPLRDGDLRKAREAIAAARGP